MAAPLGNQNAKRAKLWTDAIKRALARTAPEGDRTVQAGLDRLADRLVEAAGNGDQWALREIGDRVEGKPAQVIVGDDDAPPVRIQKIERVVVEAHNSDS